MIRKRYLAVGGGLAIAAVVAAVLAVVALAGGGGKAETSVVGAGGASEGISVHGHWAIEVRQPDGAFVRRKEFDNDLFLSGSAHLAALLKRDTSMGLWSIWASGGGGSAWLCSEGVEDCEILEATTALPAAPHRFKNLTVSRPEPWEVQLSGSFTPSRDGSLGGVATNVSRCSSSEAPGSCSDVGQYNIFTAADLPTPVGVLAGQQVLVRVTISFSTANPTPAVTSTPAVTLTPTVAPTPTPPVAP